MYVRIAAAFTFLSRLPECCLSNAEAWPLAIRPAYTFSRRPLPACGAIAPWIITSISCDEPLARGEFHPSNGLLDGTVDAVVALLERCVRAIDE